MKVTVIGAGGNVGSTVALSVAQRDFAKEVIALDLERKQDDKTFYPSKGRALDQWEASPIHLFDTRVKGLQTMLILRVLMCVLLLQVCHAVQA